MAGKLVKRLYDLEIDEISLVDRSANQHADVAIAKRDEDTMTVIDERGAEVDLETLEPGDVVFDSETGEPLVACEEGAEPSDYYELDEESTEELAEVGKSLVSKASPLQALGPLAAKARQAGASATYKAPGLLGTRNRRLATGAGGAALAGAGAGRFGKSLGEEVYESLSKALNDDSRNEVISKALEQARDEVAEARREAKEAWEFAKGLQDQLEEERLTEIAKNYGVPGKPEELVEILKSLPPEHAARLDQVLSSVGEQLFEQHGSDLGDMAGTVHGQIEAMAAEAVTKADVSAEAAVTALYDANPAAYDQYLAENA